MTALRAITQRTWPATASRLRLGFAGRVFVLALILRLLPVLLTARLGIGLDDMFQYDMLARSLAAGNGYRWYAQPDLYTLSRYIQFDLSSVPYDPKGIPTSYRAPLYPAFLALIYALSGLEWRFFAARLAQAVLGATLAPLTYWVARRLISPHPPSPPLVREVGGMGTGDKDRAARYAALIVALYPWLILFPLGLATENLFIPLLALAILALLRAGEAGSLRDWALAGVALGLATLTRSIIVGFVPLAILLVPRNRLRGGLILLGCVAALTLPWAYRNTRLHGQLTFVENNLGTNLYLGYHPKGTGTFQFGISLDLVPILDDAERNRRGIEAALDFIRDDPGRVPYLIVRKLGYFWGLEKRPFVYFYSNNYLGHWPDALLALALLGLCLPFVLLMPLAVIGALQPFSPSATTGNKPAGGRPWEARLLIALILYFTGAYALILAEERYHLPLIPFLAVFAAWGATQVLGAKRQSSHRRSLWRPALALSLIALLLLNWGLELQRDAPKLAAMFGPTGNLIGTDY